MSFKPKSRKAQLKRNARKIDRDVLSLKVAMLKKPWMEYTVEMLGFLMKDR